MMRQKFLNVPYFIQPTSDTCQSTCLKMFAKFLGQKGGMSNPAGHMEIQKIWKEINTTPERPSTVRNAYVNMKWWLERYFQPQKFHVLNLLDVNMACEKVVRHIDHGFPVMVSTNHARTSGHIILVIGYETTIGGSSGGTRFYCHDPYGRFDPQLRSRHYGEKKRYIGAASLPSGGQTGPGKSVIYDYDGIRRIRADQHSSGEFYLVSAVC